MHLENLKNISKVSNDTINFNTKVIDIDFYNVTNRNLFLGHKGDNYLYAIHLIIPNLEDIRSSEGGDNSSLSVRMAYQSKDMEKARTINGAVSGDGQYYFLIPNTITSKVGSGVIQFEISKISKSSSGGDSTESSVKEVVAKSKRIPYIIEESLEIGSEDEEIIKESSSKIEDIFSLLNTLSLVKADKDEVYTKAAADSRFEANVNKVITIDPQQQGSDNVSYPAVTAVRNYIALRDRDMTAYVDGELNSLYGTIQEGLNGKEDKANKVIEITDGSTADQYPTVAAVKNYRNELLDKSRKNLIAFTNVPETDSQDVKFSINDNWITVSGTAKATANAKLVIDFNPQIELEAGTYMASIRDEDNPPSNVMIYFYIQGSEDIAFQINGGGAKKRKFEPAETVFIRRVIIGVGAGKDASTAQTKTTAFHLQLEKGEEATDYEPPYKIKNSLIPDNIADKAEIATLDSAKADKSEVYTKTITDEKFAEVAAEIDKVFESQTEVAAYLNSPQAKAGQTVKVKDAITGNYINYVIQEINGNFTITALEDLLFDTQIIDPVNLLLVSGNEKTLYGVTATIDNQTISLSGTATQAMNLRVRIPTVNLKSGTYTLKRFLYEGAADFSVSLAKGVQTPTTIEYSNIITISKGAADYKTINLENDIDINYISFYIIPTETDLKASFKLHLQEGEAVPYSWGNPNKEKEYTFKEKLIPHHMNYIYVSNEYNLTTEGFGKTCFDSIIAANDSITDNSKENPYTIIVKSGTTAEPCVYNEFETLYGGSTGEIPLQGIRTKNYVYYESETPDNPAACVLTWDGAAGYNAGELTNELAQQKCIFHLANDVNNPAGGMHTHIKGFTMQSKNTRYGIHMESGGYGRNREWLVENCIIEYGGRPDIEGGEVMPVIGVGMSPHEIGTIRKVKAFFSESFSAEGKRTLNVHDNYETSKYSIAPAVKAGARIIIENCNFCGKIARFATKYKPESGVISETLFVADIINSINISSIDSTAWRVNLLESDPKEYYTKAEVDAIIESLRNELTNQ